MTLGRDLLEETAPDHAANPLGLIGLSPEILSLGLTVQETYSVCRRFAKIMLAEVHADRVELTPRTERLQRRFSQAMEDLKSEETFAAALAAFSRASSVERSDMTALNRLLADRTASLAAARDKIEDLERDLATARGKNGHLNREVRLSAAAALAARKEAKAQDAFSKSEARKYGREVYTAGLARVSAKERQLHDRQGVLRNRARLLRGYRARLWAAGTMLVDALAHAATFNVTVNLVRAPKTKLGKPVQQKPTEVQLFAAKRALSKLILSGKVRRVS